MLEEVAADEKMRRRSFKRVNVAESRAQPRQRQERPVYAIGQRLIAVALLSLSFAIAKLVHEHGVHVVEMLFYRQLFSLPLVVGWIIWSTGAFDVRTQRFGAHSVRAGLGLTGMALNYGSFILLPLAEATTLGFAMPVFATIFSALILREATGWHRWSAVIVGFLGVVTMVRPDSPDVPLIGIAVAIIAAIVTALISIYLRQLSRTEDSAVIVFWFSALSIPPLLLAMLIWGRAHDAETWGLLLLLGLSGGLAQLFLTNALRWGPVAVVLTMDYSAILWATLIGAVVWHTWPAPQTWLGASLIIGAGLYIARREHKRHVEARSSASAATGA